MKGDLGRDVACPIEGCGAILHPRYNKARMRRGSAYATSEHMMKRALRQHLEVRHSYLRQREVSLLLDKVIGTPCPECGHEHHKFTDGYGEYCAFAVSDGVTCWCKARRED